MAKKRATPKSFKGKDYPKPIQAVAILTALQNPDPTHTKTCSNCGHGTGQVRSVKAIDGTPILYKCKFRKYSTFYNDGCPEWKS